MNVLGGETLKLTYRVQATDRRPHGRPPRVGKDDEQRQLAQWWKQQGRNPLLVGADLQRPAAVEQLRVLGDQVGVTVFSEPTDPVSVAKAGLAEAQRLGRDICIIDTAGRLTIDAEMMEQIKSISKATEPHYTFLVIDAMIGQDAVTTAKAFHDALEVSGVILTKLDGNARGGAALSVKGVVGRPIAFASTGERLVDFDLFHPDRMAERILGMGDVLSLIEQAERTMDTDEVAKSASRLMQGQFTLEDFLSQLRQVKKMGSLGGIMRLMPGMNKEMPRGGRPDRRRRGRQGRGDRLLHDAGGAQRHDDDGRLPPAARVAHGSGTTVQDVNSLLKQFKEMQKMMKGMASGNMPNLPGMPNMSGISRHAARKLTQQAAGLGGAGQGASPGAPGGADFDMLSQLMGGDASDADLAEMAKGFPGLPSGGCPAAGGQGQQGDEEKEEGRPCHAAQESLGGAGLRVCRGVVDQVDHRFFDGAAEAAVPGARFAQRLCLRQSREPLSDRLPVFEAVEDLGVDVRPSRDCGRVPQQWCRPPPMDDRPLDVLFARSPAPVAATQRRRARSHSRCGSPWR